jgi:hypothetical protein
MSAHYEIIVYCVLALDDVPGLLQLVLVLLQPPLHLLDALLPVRVLRIVQRKLQFVYHLLLLGYEGRLRLISRVGLRDLLGEAIKLVRHRLTLRGISVTLGVK